MGYGDGIPLSKDMTTRLTVLLSAAALVAASCASAHRAGGRGSVADGGAIAEWIVWAENTREEADHIRDEAEARFDAAHRESQTAHTAFEAASTAWYEALEQLPRNTAREAALRARAHTARKRAEELSHVMHAEAGTAFIAQQMRTAAFYVWLDLTVRNADNCAVCSLPGAGPNVPFDEVVSNAREAAIQTAAGAVYAASEPVARLLNLAQELARNAARAALGELENTASNPVSEHAPMVVFEAALGAIRSISSADALESALEASQRHFTLAGYPADDETFKLNRKAVQDGYAQGVTTWWDSTASRAAQASAFVAVDEFVRKNERDSECRGRGGHGEPCTTKIVGLTAAWIDGTHASGAREEHGIQWVISASTRRSFGC